MSKIYNVITLIMRFMKKIGRDRVRAHAAEAAFFIIMSVFPILMLLLTLLRYTTLTTEQIIFTIEELTPFAITQELQPVVDSIFNQSTALVPWTALVAVWTAGKGILGLSDGLNSIFQIEETKNYFVTRFRCACYTVVMVLALTVSLFILVFGYSIETYLLKKIPLLTAYQDELTVLAVNVCFPLPPADLSAWLLPDSFAFFVVFSLPERFLLPELPAPKALSFEHLLPYP